MKKRSKVIAKKTAVKKVAKTAGKAVKKAAKGRTSLASRTAAASGPAQKLLLKLAEDPKIASAIENIDHGANNDKVTSFRDTLESFTGMTKGFISTKRAVKIAAYAEVLILAYRIGLVLKTNIFDRPEVKAYFDENFEGLKSSSIYKIAKNFVGNAISSEENESDAKSKWSEAKSKSAKGVKAKSSKGEEIEEGSELTEEEAAPKLNRQQRRHQDERKSNMNAIKAQGSATRLNREAKRHPETAARASEPHSEFIPSHPSTSRSSLKRNV